MEKIQLICLPFAGAGASFFNEWKGVEPSLVIRAMQLPGREKRFLETPHVDVHRAVDELTKELLADDALDTPTLIFGHSLGAVLAFELARRLESPGRGKLLGLVASGSPDPWTQRSDRATGFNNDEAFLAKVSEFSGYNHEALSDPMMRELLLPTLRADVRMHEDYVPRSGEPLSVPVMTVRGAGDQLVSRAQVDLWRKASTGAVSHDELEGGHMYFIGNAGPLLGRIATFARQAVATALEIAP
ncbi:thioesterase II family protein [Tahibacter amnicola]|uniref:Alpha/beta fold hydrolase n=1 Tax=Tahibacter amnicola TaxID=2976241 RepID=A0ABY6B873_9GAMM|nr:alpha/beta fold hydrolase [Tahibacter amnicola]UXI66214.1 alpha/beta fold hydrolase [Tahibacter amnicola]